MKEGHHIPVVKPLRSLWMSHGFRLCVAGIFLVQFILLLLTTPMYDIDTNSFIRGGLTWDIYHHPFLNIFIAVFSKVWANAWFLVSLQLLFYSFSATFAAFILFEEGGRGLFLALGITALEPVTLFYNFSLISESFFTSFILLSVGFLVLWFRRPWQGYAFGAGLALGLAFVCKLSGLILLPVLGLMLFRRGRLLPRLRALGIAMVPFGVCYFFVFLGQQAINGSGLYKMGRASWDFSSSQYRPEEIEGDYFKGLVHPYIFRDGKWVAHRELRRELSHLGYKDCVGDYESRGNTVSTSIDKCDSIFGAVGAQIVKKHFWASQMAFIADNFRFIHELSYLETRFTPGLHYYYPDSEWRYIDSLMEVSYGLDLSLRESRIPVFWRSLAFTNVWMSLIGWLWVVVMVGSAILYLKRRDRWEILVLWVITLMPLLFHLVFISYRTRFLAPFLVLVLWLGLCLVREIFKGGKREAG